MKDLSIFFESPPEEDQNIGRRNASKSLIKLLKAEDGKAGGEKMRRGTDGQNLIIEVPVNVKIHDIKREVTICEGMRLNGLIVAAHGGSGGVGNGFLDSSSMQCPEYAEIGANGLERLLEIRMI